MIGARLAGVVARIDMDNWEEIILRELERLKIEVYLFTKYIVDVNMALLVIPKGWRWIKHVKDGCKLEWIQNRRLRMKEDLSLMRKVPSDWCRNLLRE